MKPNDVGPQQLAARRAVGQVVERLRATVFEQRAFRAANAGQIAVQLQHVAAAGAAMQAVYVLRHQGKLFRSEALFQSDKGMVAGVGLDRSQVRPAGVVKAPDEAGIALKGERSGHVLNPQPLPKPASATKGRHAALG